MSEDKKSSQVTVLASSQLYFTEVVTTAVEKRRFDTNPYAIRYIVDLLEANISTEKFTLKTTLAEAFLRADQAERPMRLEMLKKLGDVSLYTSGFFGDSLRRKIVDIDYYADIGGSAYASLAAEIHIEAQAQVYKEFSARFLEYVDLLTYISQNSLIQSNQDLLRLYERYVLTGSELAREQLVEKGLLTTAELKKTSNQ